MDSLSTRPHPILRSPFTWFVLAALAVIAQSPFPLALGPQWIMAGPFLVPLLAGLYAQHRGIIGTVIGTILAGLMVDDSIAVIGAAAACVAMSGSIAMFAVRNGWPFSRTLDSPRDVFVFAGIVLAVAAGRSAATLVCGFAVGGDTVSAALCVASIEWFASLAIAPALMIWTERETYKRIAPVQFIETFPVVIAVIVVNYVFFIDGGSVVDSVPLPLLSVMAFLTSWIALRFETKGMASLILLTLFEVIMISVLRGTWQPFFHLGTSLLTQSALLLLFGFVIVVNLLIAAVSRVRNQQDEEMSLIVNALRQKAEKLIALNNLLAVQTGRAEQQATALLEQNGEIEAVNRKLASQQAWMDAMLASMPVGVYVIDKEERVLDRRHRTPITPGMDDKLPYQSIFEIEKIFHVSDQNGNSLPFDEWPILRAVRRGEKTNGIYLRMHLEDGTEQMLSVNAAPIFDETGAITGAVAVSMDVTEREMINERIRDQEERLRFALNAARTIAWEREVGVGMIRRTESVSEWLGYPVEMGFDDLDVYANHVHPDDRDDAKKYFYSMIQRCGEFEFEYRMVAANGEIIWVATRGEVIAGPDGKPKRIAGVHIDITAQKKAELKLRQLESAVAHARDAVVLLDAATVPNAGRSVLYVNDAFCEMSGYLRTEVVGRSLNVLRGPESNADTLDEIRLSLDAGQPLQAEILNYRKNGTAYWVDLTLELVRDARGRMSHWVMIQRDITDRKRAEDALRRSEEMFRGIFENAWAGVSLTDPHGRFISANPSFVAMLDRTETEITTLHTSDVTDPDSLRIQRPLIEEVYQGKRDRYQIRKQYIRRDGTRFWGELFFNAIRGPSGEYLYGLGVTVDVTERTKLEDQLRASEQRLRAVYENTAAGFVVVDPEAVILEVNPAFARMLGYEPADMIGIAISDLTHPDDLTHERDLLQELTRGDRDHIQVRKRYIRKDGTLVVADLFTQAVRDADRNVLFRIGVAIDVTDRIKLEDQLRQAQKMEAIGQMAGGIAHDFNNLLTAVIGNLSLVELKRGEANGPYLAAAEQAAVRAAELTQKLLGYARRSQLVLAPIHLTDVVSEVIEILRRTLDPRIVIRAEIESYPDVIGDATLLNQVLFNLCLNSRDAMPDGGRIDIGLTVIEHDSPPGDIAPGRFANLSVTDNGHGMVAEVRSKIFEPFFTTKGVGKGTGLGLAMVLGIVQQHGGWVDCDSAPGTGARFDLYLPLNPVEKSPVFASLPPPTLALDDTPVDIEYPPERHVILLVDDDLLVRGLARTVLEIRGYVVVEACDGFEAVEWVEENRQTASLIIMDLTMPRMSGRDAFRHILELDPTARVLFSSGYSADELSDVSGGVGMLAKPYRPAELLDAVYRAISGKSLRAFEERCELTNLIQQ